MAPRGRKAKLGKLAAARRRDLFYILGHPTRRRLVELIAPGEQPLPSLVRKFKCRRQAIYDHLIILRQAGLVGTRLADNRSYYRLRVPRLREVRAWISRYELLWDKPRKAGTR